MSEQTGEQMSGEEAQGLADFIHGAILRWIGKTGELSRRESPRWDNTYDEQLLDSLHSVETTLRSFTPSIEDAA
jgi:hypothetical protein